MSTKEVGQMSGHSSTRDRDRDKIDIKTEVEAENRELSSKRS